MSGAGSWLADLGRGAKRTARGLKVWDSDALVKVATENEDAVRLFRRVASAGVSGAVTLVSNMLEIAIAAYTTWALLPSKLKALAVDKLGDAAAAAIKAQVSKAVGKWAVKEVVYKLAKRVVATKAYRLIAKKLGVSAGLSSTGIGVPVAMLSLQGMVEKAARASDRLKSAIPALHRRLVSADLHMAWFLVEPSVDELREKVYARMTQMLSRSRGGRVPVDWGGS